MNQVTPEMMMFLGRTSAKMVELAASMTNEICQMKKAGTLILCFILEVLLSNRPLSMYLNSA